MNKNKYIKKINKSNGLNDYKMENEKYDKISDLIDEKSIIQNLNMKGYVILKIMNSDDKIFIKAYNKNGKTVYIFLDNDKHCIDCKNSINLDINSDLDISFSDKVGYYDTISTLSYGVIFECGSNICTVCKDNDSLKIIEKSYSLGEKENGNELIMTFSLINYSEIMENNELILSTTDNSYLKLRKEHYDKLIGKFFQLESSSKLLVSNVEYFFKKNLENIEQIKDTINILEDYKKNYESLNSLEDKNKKKYENVIKNLHIRHEKISAILKSEKILNDLDFEINLISDKIRELLEYDNKLLEDNDKVIY